MRSLLFIFASLLSFQLQAAFDGAMINTLKFEKEAKQVLTDQNINSDGRIVFQDAAYSTDFFPFDAASLYFISEESFEINNTKYNFSYELSLINGYTKLVLLKTRPGFRLVSYLDALLITFDNPVDDTQVIKIKTKFPKANILVINEINYIQIRWQDIDLQRLKDAIEFMQTNFQLKSLELDTRVYRLPAKFGAMSRIIRREVDLDKLRDVVPYLISRGQIFTTDQSIIPLRLRAR